MKISACCWLVLSMSISAQQHCFDTIHRSTVLAQFMELAPGEMLDQSTGLVWQRCLHGQQWLENEQACSGQPVRLSWAEALRMSIAVGQVAQSKWRLPDVKEAMSVVERQCVDPAIDLALFPGANSENIWTSTTDRHAPSQAWAIAMYSGKNNVKLKEQQLYVRFVRFSDEP